MNNNLVIRTIVLIMIKYYTVMLFIFECVEDNPLIFLIVTVIHNSVDLYVYYCVLLHNRDICY